MQNVATLIFEAADLRLSYVMMMIMMMTWVVHELGVLPGSGHPLFLVLPFLIFGWPFVKWFALCYRTGPLSVCLSCPSCLSVTLMHCGQMVGWIKMPLGTEMGLGPGHIVLNGNPAPLPPKKGAQQFRNFRHISIVAKRSPISATAELLFSLWFSAVLS